jgi:hypothetical protein
MHSIVGNYYTYMKVVNVKPCTIRIYILWSKKVW